jgi:hypothetical protein
MSKTVPIQKLRVQGQGIPWTTWGLITPQTPEVIKDPDYFSKAHNIMVTGDFVEVLSQNKYTEQEVLIKFYVKFADQQKAIVDIRLIDEIELVPVNKELEKEFKAKAKKEEKEAK